MGTRILWVFFFSFAQDFVVKFQIIASFELFKKCSALFSLFQMKYFFVLMLCLVSGRQLLIFCYTTKPSDFCVLGKVNHPFSVSVLVNIVRMPKKITHWDDLFSWWKAERRGSIVYSHNLIPRIIWTLALIVLFLLLPQCFGVTILQPSLGVQSVRKGSGHFFYGSRW